MPAHELTSELQTRLQYAMVKVHKGWELHSLRDVETLMGQVPPITPKVTASGATVGLANIKRTPSSQVPRPNAFNSNSYGRAPDTYCSWRSQPEWAIPDNCAAAPEKSEWSECLEESLRIARQRARFISSTVIHVTHPELLHAGGETSQHQTPDAPLRAPLTTSSVELENRPKKHGLARAEGAYARASTSENGHGHVRGGHSPKASPLQPRKRRRTREEQDAVESLVMLSTFTATSGTQSDGISYHPHTKKHAKDIVTGLRHIRSKAGCRTVDSFTDPSWDDSSDDDIEIKLPREFVLHRNSTSCKRL